MYADIATVRELAINIKSNTSDDFIRTMGRIVDSIINGKLSMVFVEWIDVMNGDLETPEIITDMANILTAARLEMTKYAVNDAGKSQPNQYGVQLRDDGLSTLDSIFNGTTAVLGLTRIKPISEAHGEGTFQPVGGLRTQSGEERDPFYPYGRSSR